MLQHSHKTVSIKLPQADHPVYIVELKRHYLHYFYTDSLSPGEVEVFFFSFQP